VVTFATMASLTIPAESRAATYYPHVQVAGVAAPIAAMRPADRSALGMSSQPTGASAGRAAPTESIGIQ